VRGETFHGFGETEVLVFLEESNGIAMGATAETVVETLVRSDVEGGVRSS